MKKSVILPLLAITLSLSSCGIIYRINPGKVSGDSSYATSSEEKVTSSSEENNTSTSTTTSSAPEASSTHIEVLYTNSDGANEDITTFTTDTANSNTTNDGYYRPSSWSYDLKRVNTSFGYDSLNPLGEQKMLVVPVQFSNGKAWTSQMLSNINKAFFGESSDTYWESVASFYLKSSYGKLKISGAVTTPLLINQRTSTITEDNVYSTCSQAFYNAAPTSMRKEYDVDNNGHIDATIFIYSNNYSTADGSPFWAWVWYEDAAKSTSAPTVGTYMWASYSFINEAGSGIIDAHTFIHESGHVLGLDDYYNTDNSWDPVGQLEMQSYNVGDQGVHTKFLQGWTRPFVITGKSNSVEINLKTSALYDESIIINNSWNGTALDEYLIIEYYTPKGNNKKDSEIAYSSRMKMFEESGLRIYHVDARLVNLSTSTDKSTGYATSFKNNGTQFVGASNSKSWSYLSSHADDYKLAHLMQSGVTSTNDKFYLKNLNSNLSYRDVVESYRTKTLYGAGDSFQANAIFFYNGANFNNGNPVGYKITCVSTGDIEAKVRIEKI